MRGLNPLPLYQLFAYNGASTKEHTTSASFSTVFPGAFYYELLKLVMGIGRGGKECRHEVASRRVGVMEGRSIDTKWLPAGKEGRSRGGVSPPGFPHREEGKTKK